MNPSYQVILYFTLLLCLVFWERFVLKMLQKGLEKPQSHSQYTCTDTGNILSKAKWKLATVFNPTIYCIHSQVLFGIICFIDSKTLDALKELVQEQDKTLQQLADQIQTMMSPSEGQRAIIVEK